MGLLKNARTQVTFLSNSTRRAERPHILKIVMYLVPEKVTRPPARPEASRPRSLRDRQDLMDVSGSRALSRLEKGEIDRQEMPGMPIP